MKVFFRELFNEQTVYTDVHGQMTCTKMSKNANVIYFIVQQKIMGIRERRE